ncbi:MAG: IPT/TIG domain-containing protein [Verrucomicrobiota bacterium]
MRKLIGISYVVLVHLSSVCAGDVFVERFEPPPPEGWELLSNLDEPGLRWYSDGEEPGFHFRARSIPGYVKQHDYAWSDWKVGTAPFELTCEVRIEEGIHQQWFFPGIAIALTSAPPEQMEKDDIAVTFSLHLAGITAAVRKGGFFSIVEEGHGKYSRFKDKDLSGLIQRGGGNIHSVQWPTKRLEDVEMTLSIRRTPDDTVEFEVRWPGLPGKRGRPYWREEWPIPDDVADMELEYVALKQVPTLSPHASGNYAGFNMVGAVRKIQGRTLDSEAPPRPTDCELLDTVPRAGTELILHGEHFVPQSVVTIGGEEVKDLKYASETELQMTLPDLETGGYHAVVVTNSDGLSGELRPGVPTGRFVDKVRPKEAHPDGGDVVELTGSGFGPETEVLIGGERAEDVRVIDNTLMRVEVPPGEEGRAELVVMEGDDRFGGEPHFGYAAHPYLFFTEEELPELREKFKKPMFEDYRRRVLEQADSALDKELEDNTWTAPTGLTANLSFAYALTGEHKYRDHLLKWLEQGVQATRYDGHKLGNVAAMAIAYDILFQDLSREQKVNFQDYLERMIEGYSAQASGSWFLGGSANFSNTVPVGNAGGMLAGLALLHSVPMAEKAVDTAASKAKLWPDKCISADGGCREGIQYWDYGGSFHLILAHALKNVTGDDRGLLDHPHLENNVNFIRTQLGGHGGMFAFNDTKQPWLDGYSICADLGSRYDQPLMLWVADRAAAGGGKTRARGTWAPFAFLWRNTEKSLDQFPGVPNLAYLEDMHWGAIRSDGSQFKPEIVVGVKGGKGPLTHHKQHDLGSFVMHTHGEAKLVDPGYYEQNAKDHTLPLIDGVGPKVDGSEIVEAVEDGPWRMMIVDSTDGYSNAERVRRVIVMHAEFGVVVVDDIAPGENNDGRVTAQYQTAWTPEVDEKRPGRMRINGENGGLLMQCYGHDLNLDAEDREMSSGWRWEKISSKGRGNWHSVRADYKAAVERPLVTVLIPFKKNEDPVEPDCEYDEERVDVRFGYDASVHFERQDGTWIAVW